MPVSIGPGLTLLTRIPRSISSIARFFVKLGASSRTEAVSRGLRSGLIEL